MQNEKWVLKTLSHHTISATGTLCLILAVIWFSTNFWLCVAGGAICGLLMGVSDRLDVCPHRGFKAFFRYGFPVITTGVVISVLMILLLIKLFGVVPPTELSISISGFAGGFLGYLVLLPIGLSIGDKLFRRSESAQ